MNVCKLLKRVFTAKIIKQRLFNIIYIVGLILFVVFLQHNHQEPEKYVGPAPAEMAVILKQEISNFNMLPGTTLHFYPPMSKNRLVYIQADYTSYKKPAEVRAFYIEEAERNGWIFKKDENQSILIFNKLNCYQGDYELAINYSRNVMLEITWSMHGAVQ